MSRPRETCEPLPPPPPLDAAVTLSLQHSLADSVACPSTSAALASRPPRRRAVRAVCEVLDNVGGNAVMVREEAVSCLARLCGSGGQADYLAGRTLLRSVTNDTAHVVRRAAFELLTVVQLAPGERREALATAMGFLRREDLRGESLFKPNGDPLSLCAEAIGVVGAFTREISDAPVRG